MDLFKPKTRNQNYKFNFYNDFDNVQNASRKTKIMTDVSSHNKPNGPSDYIWKNRTYIGRSTNYLAEHGQFFTIK